MAPISSERVRAAGIEQDLFRFLGGGAPYKIVPSTKESVSFKIFDVYPLKYLLKHEDAKRRDGEKHKEGIAQGMLGEKADYKDYNGPRAQMLVSYDGPHGSIGKISLVFHDEEDRYAFRLLGEALNRFYELRRAIYPWVKIENPFVSKEDIERVRRRQSSILEAEVNARFR